jgi:hypothetical protein
MLSWGGEIIFYLFYLAGDAMANLGLPLSVALGEPILSVSSAYRTLMKSWT